MLRDYQRALLAETAKAMRIAQRVLVQAPTGSGKTHLIAALVSAAVAVGLRVLVLATRTRLVRQLHDRLEGFGVHHGVIAAALPGYADLFAPVQVASVDTLHRRCLVDEKFPLPVADVVVFDEGHLALGDSRQRILNHYPNAWRFGFTATPATTSGRPLLEQFDAMVKGPSVADLIGMGMLVRPRVFNQPVVLADELDGVPQSSGDYAVGALSALMNRPKLVGDVVQNWLRIANGKRTLVFGVDKGHGAQLTAEFRQAGIAAEQLTDADDDDTRERAIARLERGETLVLVNCSLLSYGIDIPAVECVVLARPTRSVVLYLQAIGRGMRPAEGKDSVIVIDHGRVVESLGLPTSPFRWSLGRFNVNRIARERIASKRADPNEKPRTCRECSAVWLTTEHGNSCPECGWKHVAAHKGVRVQGADLLELDGAKIAADRLRLERFYAEACGWYAARWPDRWMAKPNSGRWYAWTKANHWLGVNEPPKMPRHCWTMEPIPPSAETAGWLKSQMIRWAKGQQKRKAA